MRDGDETAEFDDVKVLASTDKAVLCDFSESGSTKFDGKEWIPFSQIAPDSEIDATSEPGDEGRLECSLWIASQKSLV